MSQYAHPEVLVDTQWLLENLNNPQVRIVEVDTNPQLYKDAHIPGAVFWNIFSDILLPNLQINFDPAAMANLLSRSGINNNQTVVAYGSYPGTGAWIFWLLKVLGHENVLVLNGGYQKWMAENLPVATGLSDFPPSEYCISDIDLEKRIFLEEVQASIGNPNRVLLDVRSLAEYRGEFFFDQPPVGKERAGHIPGAVHVEHLLTLNADGTFKSFAQLQALYASQGITPDKEIIPYCAIGGRSGFTWFVLKYLLGYPQVRNFDGSWNEWSRVPDVAIER
ncbi:sulfurtransferase [Calothrix sp. FACHB-1219]|uniref:sulfurtransferase n=1 Tax=unclassified Calothrix TaxID=2619626 RepID=UPI0016897828|nr:MULTISPECIES: sulfurtransferase [unclassified Calothrix]MBD2203821.1 sulfurtransferase [Calothrix sp. FACHB-168]MBD2219639.1 sulfurtransferase [Calothrix sp. FACHB-1219]